MEINITDGMIQQAVKDSVKDIIKNKLKSNDMDLYIKRVIASETKEAIGVKVKEMFDVDNNPNNEFRIDLMQRVADGFSDKIIQALVDKEYY